VPRPFVFVLAGVNGAGKSSVGGAMLQQHGLAWFNPDTYARRLVRELGVELAEANARAWAYGKSSLEAALAQGTNFAFETTLGGKSISRLLAKAAETHSVMMLYCGLSSPELHIARVAQRVAHGGHPIAQDRIRERWTTSRVNLVRLLPTLTRLQVYDNSASVQPGEDLPDPVLLLDVEKGRLLFPDAQDAAALRAVPAWARPIVQAAVKLSGA
jgi:predicted ABC-type ATPase